MRINRRSFLTTAGGIGIASQAGCLGSVTGGSSGPITIGAPLPLSGPLALVGGVNREGFETALEYHDGEVAGREVELKYEDTKTNPSTGLQKVRSLVGDEGVDALAGVSSSAVAISTVPYLKNEAQIPFVFAQAGTTKVREDPEMCSQYAFFPFPSNRSSELANATFTAEDLGGHVDADPSRVHYTALDYEAGQNHRDWFTSTFEDLGGEVVGTTMVPFDVSDFAPYLPEMENADADVVAGWYAGAPAIQLFKQAAEFGLTDEKVFSFAGDTTMSFALAQMGKAANGTFGSHFYRPSQSTGFNEEFKGIYSEQSDLPPSSVAATAFNGLHSLLLGMEEAGGADPDAVVSAMAGMQFESPLGQVMYRPEDHQLEVDFFGFQIEGGSRKPLSDHPDVLGPVSCTV